MILYVTVSIWVLETVCLMVMQELQVFSWGFHQPWIWGLVNSDGSASFFKKYMLKKLVLGVWCLVLVFEYRVWVRLGTEGIYLLRNTQYMYVGIYIYILVGGLEQFVPYIGNVIIPTDELIFYRGVGWNHQAVYIKAANASHVQTSHVPFNLQDHPSTGSQGGSKSFTSSNHR